MILPYDSWTLARLLAGLDPDGRPWALSDPFRELADRLTAPLRRAQNEPDGRALP